MCIFIPMDVGAGALKYENDVHVQAFEIHGSAAPRKKVTE